METSESTGRWMLQSTYIDSILLPLIFILFSREKCISEMSLRIFGHSLSTASLLTNYMCVDRPPSTPPPSGNILILSTPAIFYYLHWTKSTYLNNAAVLGWQHCLESVLGIESSSKPDLRRMPLMNTPSTSPWLLLIIYLKYIYFWLLQDIWAYKVKKRIIQKERRILDIQYYIPLTLDYNFLLQFLP